MQRIYIEDMIMERLMNLTKEWRQATVPVFPQQASNQDPDDSVVASQEEPNDQLVPKDTHDNVSAESVTLRSPVTHTCSFY